VRASLCSRPSTLSNWPNEIANGRLKDSNGFTELVADLRNVIRIVSYNYFRIRQNAFDSSVRCGHVVVCTEAEAEPRSVGLHGCIARRQRGAPLGQAPLLVTFHCDVVQNVVRACHFADR
jgi:hypothetical protein